MRDGVWRSEAGEATYDELEVGQAGGVIELRQVLLLDDVAVRLDTAAQGQRETQHCR